MLYIAMCHNNTGQITDISTLQFICTLHNFMHIVSMQSNGAATILSGSSHIRQQIFDHIQFRPELNNWIQYDTSLLPGDLYNKCDCEL